MTRLNTCDEAFLRHLSYYIRIYFTHINRKQSFNQRRNIPNWSFGTSRRKAMDYYVAVKLGARCIKSQDCEIANLANKVIAIEKIIRPSLPNGEACAGYAETIDLASKLKVFDDLLSGHANQCCRNPAFSNVLHRLPKNEIRYILTMTRIDSEEMARIISRCYPGADVLRRIYCASQQETYFSY